MSKQLPAIIVFCILASTVFSQLNSSFFNASATETSNSNQIAQSSSSQLNDIFANNLANLQDALKNETLYFDKKLTLYKNGDMSKDEFIMTFETHISQLKSIYSQYDDLNPSPTFTESLNLFKRSTQLQINSDEYLLDWIKTDNATSSTKSDELLQESYKIQSIALQSYLDAENNVLHNVGLHNGEWVQYEVTFYPPKTSSGLKEFSLLSNQTSIDTDSEIANVQSMKITIKNVLNDSYTYDSSIHLKNGTQVNINDLVGNFFPNDQYMLAVPIHLKIGDIVHGMAFYHDGIVKSILSKPMFGKNIDVYEIVEDHDTNSGDYVITTNTDSLYDKDTGILLYSTVNLSVSSQELGSDTAEIEIKSTNFFNGMTPNYQVVPEFGSVSGIIIIVAVIGSLVISKRFSK